MDNELQNGDNDVKWTQMALSFFGGMSVFFMVAYCLYGAASLPAAAGNYWLRFAGLLGVSATVGFAAFALGGLLGLLFGVPKSISEGSQSTGADRTADAQEERRLYRSNTNLEEMSDWLTKIIIGASLVEVKSLFIYFETLVTKISAGLAPAPFAPTVLGAEILGFGVLGFFTVYLLTRLFLAGAFSRADSEYARSAARAQSLANLDLNDLTSREKDWLRKITAAHDSGTELRVPPDFVRESPEHEALRSLKDRLIIRPRGGGSWRPNKAIDLTPIAERIIDKLKEAIPPNPA